MNIKDILNSYNEFTTNYYMNNQDLLDNNYNREIAEAIATKEAIELSENK